MLHLWIIIHYAINILSVEAVWYIATLPTMRESQALDSAIDPARLTHSPAVLHLWIIIFCARKIFSVGISIPKSPRATMIPSDSRRMSSKFSKPSWFSTWQQVTRQHARRDEIHNNQLSIWPKLPPVEILPTKPTSACMHCRLCNVLQCCPSLLQFMFSSQVKTMPSVVPRCLCRSFDLQKLERSCGCTRCPISFHDFSAATPTQGMSGLPLTFEMMWMDLLYSGPSRSRMALRSEPLRTKEAAMKSILLGTPQFMMSLTSFSVMVGRSTTTPGRFTFLRSPSTAVFSQRQRTVLQRPGTVVDEKGNVVYIVQQ